MFGDLEGEAMNSSWARHSPAYARGGGNFVRFRSVGARGCDSADQIGMLHL